MKNMLGIALLFLVPAAGGTVGVGIGTGLRGLFRERSQDEAPTILDLVPEAAIEPPCARVGPILSPQPMFTDAIRLDWEPWPENPYNTPGSCLPSSHTWRNATFGGTLYVVFRESLPAVIDEVVVRYVRTWEFREEETPVESEGERSPVRESSITGETYADFGLFEVVPCGEHVSMILVGRNTEFDRDVAILGSVFVGATPCEVDGPTIELIGVDPEGENR
jgi:hypothetical protein